MVGKEVESVTHPIEGLMKTALENIKEMIDVNTIVGDAVEAPDGSVILPVSKVGFGFAAGGSEFESSDASYMPFGGGSGGGISIQPVAFLVVNSQGIRLLSLDNSTHLYERALDLAPQVLNKIQQMLQQNRSSQEPLPTSRLPM
ncbi:MAG: sporulation protein YtfJ [Bacillaceae bacterium G1]|nr:sporulation protein YtfJ [Bacillota bacterium]OJF17575.1 MAG: sporulation protein YtfJ [Bacillaceae bacterium G1]